MRTQILLLGLFFTSCTTHKEDKQILDYKLFTIETPKGWKKVDVRGIDSYVGIISIDSSDDVSFDLGRYSNSLNEYRIEEVGSDLYAFFNDTSINPVNAKDSLTINKLLKNDIVYSIVAGYKATIVFPKQSGKGTTGVYIDSLWGTRFFKDGFCLYGENLKPANQKLFLDALKTLNFHKPKYTAP